MKIKIDNKPWLETLKNDIVFLPLSSKANEDEIIDEIEFDEVNLPSGIFFYRLQA